MEHNLFTNLFKYKESDSTTPLENYLTELFAYILRGLIEEKNPVVCKLMNNLFLIPINERDLPCINVETQREFYVSKWDRTARPDIKITIQGKQVFFIECKVDSVLNQYKDFDQIQLYEEIECNGKEKNMGVRTLSKYALSTKSKNFLPEHSVFWRRIYSLFKENFGLKTNPIISNFLAFLEENGMAERKELEFSKEGLNNYFALYDFLAENLNDFATKENCSRVEFYGNSDYFGFTINYNKKAYIWVGTYKEDQEPRIIVETMAENEDKVFNKLENKSIYENLGKSIYEHRIFAAISIAEIQKGKTSEDQSKIFANWLEKYKVADVLDKSRKVIG